MSDYGCIFVRRNNLGNNWGWRSISKWYVSNFSQLIAFSAFLGSARFVFSVQLQTPVAQENALLFLQQSSKNVSNGFDIHYYKQCFMRKPQWCWACSRHQFSESFSLLPGLSTQVVLLRSRRKMCWRKSIRRSSGVWTRGLIFQQLLDIVRCERQSLYNVWFWFYSLIVDWVVLATKFLLVSLIVDEGWAPHPKLLMLK